MCVIKLIECYKILFLFPHLHTIWLVKDLANFILMHMTSFSPCSYRSTWNPNQNSGVWIFWIVINCTIILNLGHLSYEEKNPWSLHEMFYLSVNSLNLFIFWTNWSWFLLYFLLLQFFLVPTLLFPSQEYWQLKA